MSNTSPQGALAGAPLPASQLAADLNAGFAFFLDCVVNLFVLSSILIFAFDFPRDVLFSKVIPGAVAGIVFGNLAFVYYARRVVKKTGIDTHTSLPIGIDLPTLFAMAFFIVGPTYADNVAALGRQAAANEAWVVGMAATFWIAGVKFVLSFFGRWMQKYMPQSALIGAMAGIATVWLGAEAMLGVLSLPEVGIVAFFIMIFTLVAGHKLPFNMPGAILAIAVGTALYYALAGAGVGNGYEFKAVPALEPAFFTPSLLGLEGMGGEVLRHLGIIIPFALLIAASSVNVVSGAEIVGDRYDPATVVRIDAGITALSALMGGVVQTTPYFGHTTYKRMGARTGYALGVAIVVLVGGVAGVIALASELIPESVLKPILMVVASDILRLSFSSTDVRHAPAVLFSLIPAIFNYSFTKVSDLFGRIPASVQASLGADWTQGYLILGALSRGYILTSLIWGAMLVWIIDGKLKRAAGATFAAAIFALFGMIHSVLPSSGMYVPWDMPDLGGAEILATRLAAAYGIATVLLVLCSFLIKKDDVHKG